jgi:hypothetical protein
MTGQSPPPPDSGWPPAQPAYAQSPPQPYGGWAAPQQHARPPLPPTVGWAAAGLFVAAILVLVSLVVSWIDLLEALAREAQVPGAGNFGPLTRPQSIFAILVTVATAVIYGWLAVMLIRRRDWARVAATVLLAQAMATNVSRTFYPFPSGMEQAIAVVQLVVAAAVLVLLWVHASRPWFAARGTG